MPHYSDIQSWIGGVIEICFFTDYILSRFTGYSLLRAMVLKVDEKINEFQEQVEMKVFRKKGGRTFQTETGSELRQRRVGGADESKDPVEAMIV